MTIGTSTDKDEVAVRAVIDAMAQAVRLHDVEAMLACCTPDLVTFDMVPPLRHEGVDGIRAIWSKALASYEPPVEYEVQQLKVFVDGHVAFSRSLNRFGGKRRDGSRSVTWHCSTLGLRKIGCDWKIVHQHISIPYDMATGSALLDLEP